MRQAVKFKPLFLCVLQQQKTAVSSLGSDHLNHTPIPMSSSGTSLAPWSDTSGSGLFPLYFSGMRHRGISRVEASSKSLLMLWNIAHRSGLSLRVVSQMTSNCQSFWRSTFGRTKSPESIPRRSWYGEVCAKILCLVGMGSCDDLTSFTLGYVLTASNWYKRQIQHLCLLPCHKHL